MAHNSGMLTNDVGVATLPGNASPFAMAVYIKASMRDSGKRPSDCQHGLSRL
ncbi:MAG: hypothetical protein JO182_25400 [Acidobacteriaceae bacterium]|nr:hypothetical protein [Acidobacteriaceae bacterium]